ncbi:hypothetical protein CSAL01_05951 [Colletotrichum salicis]|uniref:Uncharacterized protein n=1 Tax=Colletotrichum salicis TaxID=1209931 RepID=A0A135U0L0_9PEZI|nr:hypothetical protein CSAL01_05951 [Colletotrichum salicis]
MKQHEDIPLGRKSNHKPYNIRRKPIASNTFSYEPMYLETSSGTATNNGIWRPREEANHTANARSESSNTPGSMKPSLRSQISTCDTETNASTNALLKTRANAKIAANNEESNIKGYAGQAASWRPSWLRPLVLALFASLFCFLSVALAAMLFLTILTVFWARVELQAMMYMPWISLQSGSSPGESDLALDYTTMFLPLVFPRSFRQKHYLVFLVASISTLLKAQVILVPGLYSLVELQITSPVDILLQDTFDLNLLTDATYALDSSPYYMARAQHDFDVVQSYGVAEGFAYQTFFTGSDLGRGTVANPVAATVDGIFTSSECLKLNSYSIFEQHNIDNVEGRGYPEINFTVALQFDGCEELILFVHNWAWQEPELGPYIDWVMEGDQKVQRPCSGLPLQAPAFIYYNGAFTLGGDENSPLAEYHSAAGVICEPYAWLSKVQVTNDGVKPKLMAVSDERQTLSTPNIWTMINMSLPTGVRWTGRILAGLGPVSVDLGFRGYTKADWPKV